MKKILFALTSIFFLFLFTSCSHSQNSIPKGIYKLVGLWEMKSEKETLYEYWKVNPDSSLTGMDFIINSKGDTTILEKLEIICKDSNIYYVATVLDQNEGKPIYFKMNEWTQMVFAFENKQHDFPQLIRYSIKTADLYTVIIEGPGKGNEIKSIEFRFTRKKE